MAETIYNINSLSLKEHIISNIHNEPIYFSLKVYDGKSKSFDSVEGYGASNSISSGDEETIELEKDGIYKIAISTDSNMPTGDSYTTVINNNTSMIEAQQDFITKLLSRLDCVNCDSNQHNSYYDFITFSILIKTYEELIKEFHGTSSYSDMDLAYQIWYIQKQLKKYYNHA